MSVDTIADMFSKIKNACMRSHSSVEVSHSKLKEEIAKLLKKEGFVKDIRVFKEKGSPRKVIRIDLSYEDGKPKILGIKRISKAGRRVYKGYRELKPVLGGLGVALITTSRGVLTDKEARKRKLGGEVICEIW